MITKLLAVGTKPLALMIGYEMNRESFPANQDPTTLISISRGNYTPEQARALTSQWPYEETEKAITTAINVLRKREIRPLDVRDFVDDRYGIIPDSQKLRLLNL